MEIYEEKHVQMKHPFTAVISGPTGSGKTFLLRDLLQNHKKIFYNLGLPRIIWCYGQWQDTYSKPVLGIDIHYVEGLPEEEYIKNFKPNLIVLDDLMSELSGNTRVANLFTRGSHHMNISVFFIVQNLFHKGKEMRTVNLNTHYYFLIKNPRDKLQVMSLGRQMYPGKVKYFMESYEEATAQPYAYLNVDLKPDTPDILRLRSELTKGVNGGFTPIIHIPTNVKNDF